MWARAFLYTFPLYHNQISATIKHFHYSVPEDIFSRTYKYHTKYSPGTLYVIVQYWHSFILYVPRFHFYLHLLQTQ